MAYTFNNCYCE